MKKSLIKIIGFCTVLVCVLNYVNQVFEMKYGDGIYDMVKFYELEPDTVDVLILGSSHAFESFNTGTLWDEYGMSSFVLGGSVQPMWNTYYYLKEALKTQTPQLIVLEGYMTIFSSEYIDDSRIIKNTYGLKWSKDKIDAIKISSPKDRWKEFLIEYFQYHTRYTELSRADFFRNQGNPLYADWKGFGCNMRTQPLEAADVAGVMERGSLYDKTEIYYRMTIELAQENNIPIIVVISPYAGINAQQQAVYNAAEDIANEYDVPFMNANLLINDIGIDFSIDAADQDHLNYRGNQKFSRAMGAYIKETFGVSDHRGNPAYQTWENDARYITCMIQNQELVETSDINEIIRKIQNPNYTLIVSVDGKCTTGDETLRPLFDALGISHDEKREGFWYITNPVGVHYFSGVGEAEKYMRPDYHDFRMTRTLDESTQTYTNIILIDNKANRSVANGVNLRIYDNVTQSIVDSFGFDMDASYQLTRK